MTTVAPVKEGDILAGKYRIERVLGVGGMGIVVAAHHVQLEQHVALKFLLPEALSSPDIVARFAREARSAAKIQSEHVARVIDVGTLESGSPYMVMEYLDGSDLAQVLYDQGVVPVAEACEFIMQACEAIAEAHAAGIVHRDLKPANLFLAKRTNGRAIIKVLDFGISKVTEKGASVNEDLSLTKASTLVGSPLYMSPEQMASAKSVDARSDIWALGVILYELVSGLTPFTADSVTEMIAAVLQTKPRALSEVRDDVPPGLSAVIMRCLEKDPAQRFQSASELAAALWPFAPAKATSAVRRAASYVATSPTLASSIAGVPSPARFTPRNVASDVPNSSMHTLPAPPPDSRESGAPARPPISPVSSTAASPVHTTANGGVRNEPVASSGVVSPQPMTVTDPTWGGTNGGQPNAPPRRTMVIGAILGMFATIGVIAFVAAFAMRAKEPGTVGAPTNAVPAPLDVGAVPPAAASAAAPSANATPSAVLSASVTTVLSAPTAQPAIASAAPSITPARSAATPPKSRGPKSVSNGSPAASPPATDPKLEIRMTR